MSSSKRCAGQPCRGSTHSSSSEEFSLSNWQVWWTSGKLQQHYGERRQYILCLLRTGKFSIKDTCTIKCHWDSKCSDSNSHKWALRLKEPPLCNRAHQQFLISNLIEQGLDVIKKSWKFLVPCHLVQNWLIARALKFNFFTLDFHHLKVTKSEK